MNINPHLVTNSINQDVYSGICLTYNQQQNNTRTI